MKLLISGMTGRLGSALIRCYSPRYKVLCLGRAELDLSRPDSVAEVLRGRDFDLLINCAAITSPDACERQPELARRVNTESPAAMAAECQRRGARMIQISTDYVFGGEKSGQLDEVSPAEPVNQYGQTKREAELEVLSSCPAALVARVSWLFGSGSSFPDQILREAREGRQIEAIGDKWSVPTSVYDIARWLEAVWQIEPQITGPLHLCNSGSATWQSYGQTVVDLAHDIGLLDQRVMVKGNRLDDFPHFIARRPRHTVMSNARLSAILGHEIRSWQEALNEWLIKKPGS